jgi:phosphomannomutase
VKNVDGSPKTFRPSGTEQIVRVYAEAATEGDATELAKRLERLIIG